MAAVRLIGWILVAATGIAGVLAGALPTSVPWAPMSLHAVFGVLLLSLVVLGSRRGISQAPLSETAALALCRRLSRSVYLVLYLTIGGDQLVRAGWNAAALQPPENLRDYFAYGLLALVTIRTLLAISVRRPPTPRMNPRLARVEDAVAPP
jgi:cytochrome b561